MLVSSVERNAVLKSFMALFALCMPFSGRILPVSVVVILRNEWFTPPYSAKHGWVEIIRYRVLENWFYMDRNYSPQLSSKTNTLTIKLQPFKALFQITISFESKSTQLLTISDAPKVNPKYLRLCTADQNTNAINCALGISPLHLILVLALLCQTIASSSFVRA